MEIGGLKWRRKLRQEVEDLIQLRITEMMEAECRKGKDKCRRTNSLVSV